MSSVNTQSSLICFNSNGFIADSTHSDLDIKLKELVKEIQALFAETSELGEDTELNKLKYEFRQSIYIKIETFIKTQTLGMNVKKDIKIFENLLDEVSRAPIEDVHYNTFYKESCCEFYRKFSKIAPLSRPYIKLEMLLALENVVCKYSMQPKLRYLYEVAIEIHQKREELLDYLSEIHKKLKTGVPNTLSNNCYEMVAVCHINFMKWHKLTTQSQTHEKEQEEKKEVKKS